ncbi:MAG: hypothetical protein HN352_06745 [Bacteroidetes bacterium]|jgi:hypothetical protein|nr:hypothetical protein [Bacteroidota bacterium]MBT4399395.1 hypothetical protein [Bacteroidota bacterium]MBT4409794.1 hypothetical protein [Bacteroidota bacterium]MBT7094205.1 hypothetical protein [Bacteroidota bacterium]MBT7465685.1 hypothetical protein [Bacteroidota bacterium]
MIGKEACLCVILIVLNCTHGLGKEYQIICQDEIKSEEKVPFVVKFGATHESLNFESTEGSPAIDAGDPDGSLDPDGIRRDIGAIPTMQETTLFLILTEINYRPMIDGVEEEGLEFIEIYNAGDQLVNLNEFEFSGGFSYTFESNLYLSSGEYMILVKDESFWDGFGGEIQEWDNGRLSNESEPILLTNSEGQTVFSVTYGDDSPWPEPTEYYNYSIELNENTLEHEDGSKWHLSYQYGGSPGKANENVLISEVLINEVMPKNDGFIRDEFSEYSDWIELFNISEQYLNVAGIYVTIDPDHPDMGQIGLDDFDQTTIEPGGYLLLWADEKPQNGLLHLDFKLPSQGSELAILQSYDGDFVLIDKIDYERQYPDISYGR